MRSKPSQLVLWTLAGLLLLSSAVAGLVLVRGPSKHFVTIDLTHRYNGELHMTWLPRESQRNNLANFPRGRQVLQGTPFDVRGVLQLQSSYWQTRNSRFPQQVRNIPIGCVCRYLRLLHTSTGQPAQPGTSIAVLELHYVGGQSEKIEIRQDEQVIDWNAELGPSDRNSAVAWIGDNPSVARRQMKIRLCQSRLLNPQPKNKIESLDVLSTMAPPGYCLLGLTLEK